MSLQWVLIAGILFAEIAVVLLLSFPIVSPSKWNKLIKSKFAKAILHQLQKYFNFLLFALVLFLCDSIRELRKYSDISAEDRNKYAHLDAEMLIQLRLFRSQRNFYVSCFTLVLSLVIRRLVSLISEQAELLKALKNQTQSADTDESTLMSYVNSFNQSIKLSKRVKELEEELEKEKKDKESLTAEYVSVKKEYRELLTHGGLVSESEKKFK